MDVLAKGIDLAVAGDAAGLDELVGELEAMTKSLKKLRTIVPQSDAAEAPPVPSAAAARPSANGSAKKSNGAGLSNRERGRLLMEEMENLLRSRGAMRLMDLCRETGAHTSTMCNKLKDARFRKREDGMWELAAA